MEHLQLGSSYYGEHGQEFRKNKEAEERTSVIKIAVWAKSWAV